jgi:probable HAF family extracellular repeat protein
MFQVRTLAGLAAATLVLTVVPAAALAAPPVQRYQIVDLGTLGGASSYAVASSDRGAVIGRSQVSDDVWHGVVWQHDTMVDLGGTFWPTDINNSGQILGSRDDAPGAWVWSKGRFRRAGDLSSAKAINEQGDVLGQMSKDGLDRPALWSHRRTRTLPLDDVSDLNDARQVAGGQLVADGFHASLWQPGQGVTDLGAAAFNRSNTYRINEKGDVIGWIFTDSQQERAVLWCAGRRIDLGTLGGDTSHAVAINDAGAVLLTSQLANQSVHPALWRAGRLTDLTGLGVDPDGDLVDLNNRGEITGNIRPNDGVARAVIYYPLR